MFCLAQINLKFSGRHVGAECADIGQVISLRGVVVSYSPCKPRVVGLIPGFSSLPDEALDRGPMTIFQDKLLTRTYCDEAGGYAVPNALWPRDLVFGRDLSDINWIIIRSDFP